MDTNFQVFLARLPPPLPPSHARSVTLRPTQATGSGWHLANKAGNIDYPQDIRLWCPQDIRLSRSKAKKTHMFLESYFTNSSILSRTSKRWCMCCHTHASSSILRVYRRHIKSRDFINFWFFSQHFDQYYTVELVDFCVELTAFTCMNQCD